MNNKDRNSSYRISPLPKNWNALRRKVLKRDNHKCTASDYDGMNYYPCTEPGTEVDHIGDRDTHTLDNLQLLCHYHHREKTVMQASRGKGKRPTHKLDRVMKHPSGLDI